MPTGAAAPGSAVPWWQRTPVRILAFVAAAVGVGGFVVGGVALAGSSSTRSDADDTASEAARIQDEADEFAAQGEADQDRAAALESATTEVAESADSFAFDAGLTVAAHNAMTDVFDQAVDRFNAGAQSESRSIAEADGQEAVDAFRATVELEQEALADLQEAANALRREVDNG